ncbi:MAG: Crp/Fnr family transcriptional regulator [bacterium]|nr:Crp/Fnr family transcriptional regulator [bacterium]
MDLLQYMQSWNLNQDLSERLGELFTIREYSPGDILLNMGENTKVISLVLSGLVRGYYLDEEGRDVTKCFSWEGEWCGIYNFLLDAPSTFYIEVLEPSMLAEICVEDIKPLIEHSPEIRKLYDDYYHKAFLRSEEKGSSFQMMSGKERYLCFIKKYPEIAERVKQEYIASFIGVTPSSLSRIKRELH